ncbi:hypothetical protein HPP92_002155 [Vanilla planifolia]|uniref:Glabrous enhancer-binding protein-like DBD domain-containing protein n=1 Tax=Vanilla planifolia TaxID=51239 RepID=A0A835SE49_VANPL|nr:hypothetical protein HPP92_002155 [Vanilla planifolia]
MAKKLKEKLPSPPPPSSSSASSSSEEEESPRPAASALKKPPSSSTVPVPPKGSVPSSNSRKGKESGHDSDGSGKLSHDEDSSDDSRAVPAKSNPSIPARDSRKSIGTEASKPAAASESGSESSEDSEEDNSSSESDQPPRAPSLAAASAGTKRTAPSVAAEEDDGDDSDYSSDSNRAVSIRSSSRNAANPLLKPLNSKPMDSHVQPVERSSIFTKISAPSTASMPLTKSNIVDAGALAGGDEEKIVFVDKMFSRNDELALLQGVLDYKETHHIVPSSTAQVASFLKNFNAPMTIANSVQRIYLKLGVMKKKYLKHAAMENPKFSYVHGYTVFELSKKIWGSGGENDAVLKNKMGPNKTKHSIMKVKEKGNAIEEPMLLDNKLKPEKMEDKNKQKAKKNQFPVVFTSLHRLLDVEHAKNALLLPLSHIPDENANTFEAKCKKLDITEFRLQVKKQKLLDGALKLIQAGLTEGK